MKKIINKNWNIPPKRYNMRTLLFNHDCSRIFEWHQSIYKKITSFYHKNASMYTQWPVKNVKLLLLFTLTHFRQIFPFYTPWKHQRTFVCFSGVKNGTLTCNLKWFVLLCYRKIRGICNLNYYVYIVWSLKLL